MKLHPTDGNHGSESRPPDVSVVIPVHNGERFIEEAIDSVFRQSGFTLEVIVVDNLSTDGTAQRVRSSYGDSVILTREERPGAGPARNHGVRLARGKYLAFLDADDIWAAGKLEGQIGLLAARPSLDLVFSHCQEFHDPGLDPGERGLCPCRPEPYPYVAPGTCVLERDKFLRAGDMPDFIGEFIAWYGWTQSLGMTSHVMPDVFLRRRIHTRNWTRGGRINAGYPQALKWLLDRRRQALPI